MAKDFPDAGSYAYHPPVAAPEAYMPVIKVVPTVPANQSNRPVPQPVPSE